MTAPQGDGGAVASEAEALLARREARRFSMRTNEAGPELRFGDLDGIVFEDGLDECISANLVLWLNRMLASAKEAARPAPAGEAAEVVAPDDLLSSEFGRDLFRAVIGESYKPHVWSQHRAAHRTSVRFALDMADRSMPEVADVLRAMIWRQVIVDNRVAHARQAERETEDRATAAEAALAQARAENDKLRTLLADGPGSCIYCGLAASDMARCAPGFPGCGRADDMTMPSGPAPTSGTGGEHD